MERYGRRLQAILGCGRCTSASSSDGGSTCACEPVQQTLIGSSSRSSSTCLHASEAMPLQHLALVHLLLPLLLLLAAVPPASCQQLTPFQGRNSPPEGGTDVHMSVVVDHLVGIDELNYRFEVR